MKDKLKRQYLQINQSLRIVMDVPRYFFQPRLHSIQLVEPLEDWNYRVHSHSGFELIIPLRNTYKCSLNHQALNVPAGSFLLIQRGQLHQDFYKKDAPFRGIQFYLDCEEKKDAFPFLFSPDLPPQKQIAPFPPLASKLCDMLFESVSAKFSDTVNNAFFNSLFWLLAESFPQDLMQKTDDRNSENILTYRINRLFLDFLEEDGFSMERLQCELQVSRRTLDHIFYRLFNAPPAKAFQIFRCQLVRKFLQEHPESSLKEAAEIFHFNNQFSMSRSFRNIYGCPPSDILKHPKNGESDMDQAADNTVISISSQFQKSRRNL